MAQKQMRLGELSQQMLIAEMFPKIDLSGEASARAARLAELEKERRKGIRVLGAPEEGRSQFQHRSRRAGRSAELRTILDEIDELQLDPQRSRPRIPTEMILEQYQRELEADKEQHGELLQEDAGEPARSTRRS